MRAEAFDRITLAGPRPAEAPASRSAPILLSRALYRARSFDLRGLRGADRRDALQLQLAAWAPFDSPAYRVGLRGERVLAFAWDEVSVNAGLAEAGWDPSRPLEPEGLYRPALAEGVRLCPCLDGYEAQAWRAGLLVASQWWADTAPEAELRAFLRSHAGPGTTPTELPATSDPGWRKRPWLRVTHPEKAGESAWAGLRLAYLGTACLLALWAGMEARAWVVASQKVAALQTQEADLLERLKPMLADRDQAEQVAAKANRLTLALSGHPPLVVLEQVVAGLPAQGVQLQELNLEGRRLRLVLNLAPDVSRAAIVRQLQASGFFSEVTEARGVTASSVVFEMALPSPGASTAPTASAPAGAAPGPLRPSP